MKATGLGTDVPLVAFAAATSSMLETQRAMSLMWLEIGNDIAGHATRSLHLAFRSIIQSSRAPHPHDRPPARELLASQLELTSNLLERFAETGRDIAEVWGRYPDQQLPSTAGRSATPN